MQRELHRNPRPSWRGGCQLNHRKWITKLPAGLSVSGNLNLDGCTYLDTLPSGLKVGGYLNLRACSSLNPIPSGLKVNGGLYLSDCLYWDGVIPADIIVGGMVHTDKCIGVPLPLWRELYPNGEKSDE